MAINTINTDIKIEKDQFIKIIVNTKGCDGCEYLKGKTCLLGAESLEEGVLLNCVEALNTTNPRYYIYKYSIKNILNKL